MVRALTDADKDFDLVVYPDEPTSSPAPQHGETRSAALSAISSLTSGE
ncbi:MAG: hypothetical protein R3A46_04300 [Thermomicrobiales bacterium]